MSSRSLRMDRVWSHLAHSTFFPEHCERWVTNSQGKVKAYLYTGNFYLWGKKGEWRRTAQLRTSLQQCCIISWLHPGQTAVQLSWFHLRVYLLSHTPSHLPAINPFNTSSSFSFKLYFPVTLTFKNASVRNKQAPYLLVHWVMHSFVCRGEGERSQVVKGTDLGLGLKCELI